MNINDTIREYFAALNNRDIQQLLHLYDKDAVISDPVLDQQDNDNKTLHELITSILESRVDGTRIEPIWSTSNNNEMAIGWKISDTRPDQAQLADGIFIFELDGDNIISSTNYYEPYELYQRGCISAVQTPLSVLSA